ncbi:MAG TPA: PAS domain S-box protein [Oscillatoriales cyanobacterium M4454_W2019_049]|nr:PAS domain S-box protein [Oscillatoriales cyanobacterium M4454_W2019_049]
MDNLRSIASKATPIEFSQIEPLSSPVRIVSDRDRLRKTNISKLLDLSLEMLGIMGLDGYFEQLTPVWEECLGFSRDELQAKPWMSWIDDEDIALTRKHIKRLLDGEAPTVTFQNHVICKNGDRKLLQWQVIFCTDSKLLYAKLQESKNRNKRHHATDITSFKDDEVRFRNLVEGIKDFGIYLLDKRGLILTWNLGAESIGGWSAREMIGKPFRLLFTPDLIDRGKPEELLKLAAKTGSSEYENWQLRRDGKQFWGYFAISALKNENGKLVGFAVVMQDKTLQHKIEEALQDAYEEMEERIAARTAALEQNNKKLSDEIRVRKRTELYLKQSKASLKHQAQQLQNTLRTLQQTQAQLVHNEKMLSLGQLVAGIAHEINNPVNFIHGNIGYVKNYVEDLLELIKSYQACYPNPPENLQEILEEIDFEFIQSDVSNILASMNVGTQRIIKIVDSLRNFSRHDEAQVKKVDIHEGIESTLVILSHQLTIGNKTPIEVVKKYCKLPKVECYASQINQVLMHILQNAIDALTEKFQTLQDYASPTIWIETETQGKSILIQIKDNGVGMNAEVCQRVFDPFFTTKPVGQGTGLGLSTSYQIVVERHRGRLTCVSTPGEGTKLTIEIPIEQPSHG